MEVPKQNKIKKQMSDHGLKFNKAFGQNFLSDEDILNEIIYSAEIDDETCVLEIGPGSGALTTKLAKYAKKVVAVEIDKGLIPLLSENLSEFSNVKIINEDILKISLKELYDEEFKGEKVKVVANLPYYITTPILMKLLEENPGFLSIVVMVQKEVADRLVAEPGGKNCGAITYSVNYYCKTENVVNVPPEAFVPPPKVWSAVIKLTVRDVPPVKPIDEKHFFALIKSAFLLRRKTFINSVSSSGEMNISKEELREILVELGISETVRGEALTIGQFSQISDAIKTRNL